jgi:hypothetical protein
MMIQDVIRRKELSNTISVILLDKGSPSIEGAS